MDPISIAGLALGVASIGLQVYTGCIQGIQLLITALDYPEDSKYLNLRLRMEQQRLFAWSETSGLLDLDVEKEERVLESNTFRLHRTTVLDLLVQVQCLFKEFQEHQKRNRHLVTKAEPDTSLEWPEKDAREANFPLPQRRRDFIKKAMGRLKDTSQEGARRLRWVSFDKSGFEMLLSRFATLNDNMTDILDARLQAEIHHTVQDTNRGVLQLHHKIADLSRLVMALTIKLEAGVATANPISPPILQKGTNASGLELLAQLAKFKAFNEVVHAGGDANDKRHGNRPPSYDEAISNCLELGKPGQRPNLFLNRDSIRLDPDVDETDAPRCEGTLVGADGSQTRVWIEWKDYDQPSPDGLSPPPKELIFERVSNLAALLHHVPKPEAFRTPHCLGFFDKATSGGGDDILDRRLGLVFERPGGTGLDAKLPPVSLRELLDSGAPKPSVTARVRLAHAIAQCLLYLHSVNWLHKGLRSGNIVWFRAAGAPSAARGAGSADAGTGIDYASPVISGFDFSRPDRKDEATELAGADAAHNLYRHPHAQASNPHMAAAAAAAATTARMTTTLPTSRARFKKSFDIYSLGVVLVEIAHWAPVERVLGLRAERPSAALRVREGLCGAGAAAGVAAAMGDAYAAAVGRCVRGGAELAVAEGEDESSDAVAARLGVAFYEGVVKCLGGVSV